MAIELKETNTATKRGSGRETVQIALPRTNKSTTTSTPGNVTTSEESSQVDPETTVSRTSTRTPAAGTQAQTEDASLQLSFSIKFQNREPVPPPGETVPSAC